MTEKKNLIDAAASGTKREQLEALRDILAYSIQNGASDRDLAALTNRYIQVIEQIDALADNAPESGVATATNQSTSRRAKKS